MHRLSVWSFFFTNNTRSPRDDMLGPMYPLSNISFNCNFISPSFSVHIWCGFVDIGAKPNKNSIEKPIFCLSGNHGISLGNTSLNYFIIRCSSILSLPISNSLVAWTTYSSHPSYCTYLIATQWLSKLSLLFSFSSTSYFVIPHWDTRLTCCRNRPWLYLSQLVHPNQQLIWT